MIAGLLLGLFASDSASSSGSGPSTGPLDGIRHLGEVVVMGVRRGAVPAPIDSAIWRSSAAFGQSGPVDALRDLPGVSGQGELSGRFSTEGMPVEGTVIAWDGAEILWPWHFGGLFGALDQAAVGQVAWDPSGGPASPARGGGWLQTRSRATVGAEGVHGEVELGTISGAAGIWGGGCGFSWQATARRTWIDPALRLAKDQGWTDQSTQLLFWDGTLAVGWSRGPWSLHAGLVHSRDTISLGVRESSGSESDSWSNTAVPLGASWTEGGTELTVDGFWSRFSKVEGESEIFDTLDLLSASVLVRRRIVDGVRIEGGLRERRWTVGFRERSNGLPRFPGDRDRLLHEPHVGLRIGVGGGWAEAWGGFGLDARDPDAPEGGFSAGWNPDGWCLRLDLSHRLLPVGTLDEIGSAAESAAPSWYLPPGASTRSDLAQLDVSRLLRAGREGPSLHLGLLAWARSLDGIWSWERLGDPAYLAGDQPERRLVRSDGGAWGFDLSLRGERGPLEAGLRQTSSWNVLRRRSDGTGTYPLQWAPCDQRWQTEFDISWCWKGSAIPRPGSIFLRSRGAVHIASGIRRSSPEGWAYGGTGQVVELGRDNQPDFVWRLSGQRRAPYSRVDVTPVEFGREGSWKAWWSVANLLGARNPVGWFADSPLSRVQEVDQIPFLPVVLGVRLQF